MKYLNILFVALLMATSSFADRESGADDNVKLFAVASLANPNATIYEGDSVLVNLTIYSNYSFRKVESLDKALPKIKGTDVRAYNTERRLTQDIVSYQGQRYYAVVAEQFVVAFHNDGTFSFPARKYDIDLVQYMRRRSPFDDFFDFGESYGERQKSIQKKCSSPVLKLNVTKRPPKTMRDLEQKGAVLM